MPFTRRWTRTADVQVDQLLEQLGQYIDGHLQGLESELSKILVDLYIEVSYSSKTGTKPCRIMEFQHVFGAINATLECCSC
jgi:hypothetical protein